MDNFNLPYYAPTSEEVKKVIEVEGSFTLHKFEVFKMDWDSYIKKANIGLGRQGRAAMIATDIRAVGEPILSSQFGEEAMDNLFQRFKAVVLDHMEAEKCEYINLVISLTKKGLNYYKVNVKVEHKIMSIYVAIIRTFVSFSLCECLITDINFQ